MNNIVAPSVAPTPMAPSLTPGAIDYSWLRGDKPTQNLMAPITAPMAPMGMASMGDAQYSPYGMVAAHGGGGEGPDGTSGVGNDGSASAATAAGVAADAAAAASGNDGSDGSAYAQGGLASPYRHGGPVHPPYREEARQVANQGRGPDTMLMHVTPKELRGLASLHPSGQLPRNPQTGLPEAGFLENVLPGILGTAIGSFVGMPWLGAAIGGIGTGLATGDLGKGLLSGLMSFGLGSAFSGLAEAGATAATTAVSSVEPAANVAANVAEEAAKGSMAGAGSSTPMGFFDKAVQGISNIPDKLSNIPGTLSNIGTGLTNPTALMKNALPAASGLLSGYGLYQASQPPPPPWTFPIPRQPTGPTQPTPTNLRTPTGYAPTVATGYGSRTGEGTFFAPNPGFPYMASSGGHVKALATGGVIPRGYDSYEMARGGIASMPSGMIRGAGAGMDDAIPGTIDGRRDVRLSDGEYVLSADVVSSIGDGSSEAGARRLGKMVENIREKKYGRPKQPGKLAGGLASLGMQAGGSVNKHPFFDRQRMYVAGDIADDKVKGYKHLWEDAYEYLVDNNLLERVRVPRTEIGTWTERVRDYNERDMAEDRFPMFADGGKVKSGDRSEEVRTALLGERLEDASGNTYESIGSEKPSDFDVEDYGGRFPTYDAKDGKMNINVGGKKYFRTIPPGTLKKYPGHLPLEWMRRIEGFPTS